MANFFFGEGGRMVFNLDLITYVKRNQKTGSVYVYFGKHDSFELKGDVAKQLIALVTSLDSEADRAWKEGRVRIQDSSKKTPHLEFRK